MIQIQNAESLGNSIQRCRALRPLVQPTLRLEGGHARLYMVHSKTTSGSVHFVEFMVRDGKRFGVCDCVAGSPEDGRRARPCYHLAAALVVHLALAAQRLNLRGRA